MHIVTDIDSTSSARPEPAVNGAVPGVAAAASAPDATPSAQRPSWRLVAAAAVAVISLGSAVMAWTAQNRVRLLEQELVRRQEASQDQTTEARLLARQANDVAAQVSAQLGLLDARVAESALQRSQVEELIQSLSRSRDENVLSDVEAALRVAQQQSAITGSPDPLVAVLRQSEERLARYNQPRLERVRRAMARDLDKARAVAAVDLPTLSIRLDEAVRLIDELPLVNQPERRPAASRPALAVQAGASAAASGAAGGFGSDWDRLWRSWGAQIWGEVRALVRVSRIEHPEAMLTAPDQAFFLRENLKLRLLNARLALLSRQFDQARTDLEQAEQVLDRYFDRQSRRVVVAIDLVRLVASQSRQVVIPRPDETLAALATATAGR